MSDKTEDGPGKIDDGPLFDKIAALKTEKATREKANEKHRNRKSLPLLDRVLHAEVDKWERLDATDSEHPWTDEELAAFTE